MGRVVSRKVSTLTKSAEELLVLRVVDGVQELRQVRPLPNDRQNFGGVYHLIQAE